MPTGKDIPLGRLQLDYQEMVKAAKAIDEVGTSIDGLGKKVEPSLEKAGKSTGRLTEKLGKLSSFGRNLRQAGGFLGNDTLQQIGNVADGFGDIADSVDAIVKQKGSLGKVVGGLGAVIGGIGLGSQIYDATIGKMQGGNTTGNILDQLGKFAAAGFNQEQLAKNMQFEVSMLRVQAQNVAIDAANAVYEFKQALQKNPEAINKATGSIYDALSTLLGPAGGQMGKYSAAAASVSAEQAAKAQGEKIAQAIVQYMSRAGGIASAFTNLQSAGKNFEQRKSAAGRTYQNALDFLAKEVSQKRLDYAKQYNADTLELDRQYYQQRSELAQQYGIEAQRAEEDHQRSIKRLTEDHNKRIKKLAESRDALAIEDEVDAYKTERQRQDEDYQIAARRRSEDYANQLAQLERAHQDQEAQRRADYARQLADLQVYAAQRRAQEYAEYSLLLKDIVQAFVDARNAFAAQMQATNNTNNTANVTQNINGTGAGGGISPQDVKAATYDAITQAFSMAAR